MITFPRLGRAGRLGNQLWQIAATIGIAADMGDSFSFPAWDYAPYFSLPAEYFVGGEGRDAGEIPEHIDPRARVYLQDWNLFSKVEDQIRSFFQPSEAAYQRLTETPVWGLLNGQDKTCALHVRRGDNLRELTANRGFHPLKGPDYYQRALDYVPRDAIVVVFSDDIPWCRKVLIPQLDRETVIFEGVPRPEVGQGYEEVKVPLDWVDIQLMARCDYHVIPNSTFSWWGAFLSKDRAPVYPTPWFGPKLDFIDASLMFPPGWVSVPYRTNYRG